MPSHRFFIEAPLPKSDGPFALPLSGADLHHAVDVLRLAAGERISVVEPGGRAWSVRIVTASRTGVTATEPCELPTVAPIRITLFQGIAKGPKVDLVVEKATELNIEGIAPVLTERSVVRLGAEKRSARGERLRRVARAAAKQSGRTSVPVVSDPASLAEVVDRLATFDVVLVVWEGADPTGIGIGQALDEAGAGTESRIALVVGPEGGLTAEEVYGLEAAGARAVTLGQTVLRSETAGIVAAALCAYELGGLGGRPRG